MKPSFIMVVVCVMLVVAPHAQQQVAGLTCGQVEGQLMPCFGYLRGAQPLPTTCCTAVSNLKSAASTTQDRRTVCNCLKDAAKALQGIDFEKAEGLPAACGVNIPYKISPSTDCTKVQ